MKSERKQDKGYFLYDFAKVTGILPALLFWRPKVHRPLGNEKLPKGPFIVVSNHNSFTNPVVLLITIRKRHLNFMATTELLGNAPGRFVFRHFHLIPVDKDNFSMDTYYSLMNSLKEGNGAVIFPEGFVDTDEDMVHPFKDGAMLMALKANVPILPVYIGKRTSSFRRQHVIIGKLFKPGPDEGSRLSMTRIREMTELLYQKELELEKYYKSEVLR
ncbi:MAG: 1-acyl-sn-glycerol-3-phosphate acyltransferase [Spirochaetales bacterium]|nr:1-acyl-sn-glycerol-3-phosphate acyltransferase [Spirochaetales bacterium]